MAGPPPLDNRTFTFPYPLRFGSNGSMARDFSSKSQLLMLSTFSPNQSLHDVSYAFPPNAYEQGPMDEDTNKYRIIAITQQKLIKYIPTLLFLKATLNQNTALRQLVLAILWMDKADLARPQLTQIGMGNMAVLGGA